MRKALRKQFGGAARDLGDRAQLDLFGEPQLPKTAQKVTQSQKKYICSDADRLRLLDYLRSNPRLARRIVPRAVPFAKTVSDSELITWANGLSARKLIQAITTIRNPKAYPWMAQLNPYVVRLVPKEARIHLDRPVQSFTRNGDEPLQQLGFHLAARGLPFVGSVISNPNIRRTDLLIYSGFDFHPIVELFDRIYWRTGLLPGANTDAWRRPDGASQFAPAEHIIYPSIWSCREVDIADIIQDQRRV